MNLLRSATLLSGIAMLPFTVDAKEPRSSSDPFEVAVEALLEDHTRLAQQILADEKPTILCEESGVVIAASRYADVPKVAKGLEGSCHRIVNLPDHPEGSVVCALDVNSPQIRAMATGFVMDMNGNVEFARSGFVEPAASYDHSKDPRCKAVFHSGMGIYVYQDTSPSAGCGVTQIEETKPLSVSDVEVLKGRYCKD